MKLKYEILSSVTIFSAVFELHGITLTASFGYPDFIKRCPRRSADSGVFEAGFRINEFPAAIAGPILWHARFKG